MDLLVAVKVELGPELSLASLILVVKLGVDRCDDLSNVDPGYMHGNFVKGTANLYGV